MKKLLKLSVLALALVIGACSVPTTDTLPTDTPIPTTDVTATPVAPTATSTPIPTVTPTPTMTPWAYPTAVWITDDIPEIVEPVKPAWTDEVEVYVLLGSDYADWRTDLVTGTDNTDVFVIVIVNKETERVSLVSVPRDLYVFIPGFGMSRINTAWRHRGIHGIEDALRYNFGLPLNGFAYVQMTAFERFINDALHGIEVEVRKEVYDSCSDLTLDLLPGTHFMDGETALCYSRVRMYDGGFARQTRQREVLRAMKTKFLELAEGQPLELAMEIFRIYRDERRSTNIGPAAIVRLMPAVLDAEIIEYQMDYDIGLEHFTHPVSGAWLLSPSPCTSQLMYYAVLGERWETLPDQWCDFGD